MSSRYYNPAGKTVANGDYSDETDINDINTAINAAFELVESDIGSEGSWSSIAHKWAEYTTDSEVDPVSYPGEYSAHHWAEKAAASAASAADADDWADLAEQWAESATEVETGRYSAKYWANIASPANTVTAHGSVTGSQTLNYTTSQVHTMTAGGAITIAFSGMTNGVSCSIILVLTNGGTNMTWPSAVKWSGGTSPTLSTSGRDRLIFTSEDGGTTIDGALCGVNFS